LKNQRLVDEIEQHRQRAETFRALAATDPLTGLLNRRTFFQAVSQIEMDTLRPTPTTLIFFDIDYFQEINDTYGHSQGDQVLMAIASRLDQEVRQTDLCCRYGGDEFVILMPGVSLQAGQSVAERVRVGISGKPVQAGGLEIAVTISVGLACTSGADLNLMQLIDVADRALYHAKAVGRNCVWMDPRPANCGG
jgi:diguanylate cyclase (GGDEF)-like protein